MEMQMTNLARLQFVIMIYNMAGSERRKLSVLLFLSFFVGVFFYPFLFICWGAGRERFLCLFHAPRCWLSNISISWT